MSLKIALLKTSPPESGPISGVGRYLEELIPELESRGLTTCTFWIKGKGAGDPEVPYQRHIRGIRGYRALRFPNPPLARALDRWLRRETPDIVHAHWSWAEALTLLREARPHWPPMVISFHTYEPVCPLKTHVTVQGKACEAVGGTICLREGCRSLRKWLMHDVPTRRLRNRVASRAAAYLAHNAEMAELARRSGLPRVRYLPLGVPASGIRPGPWPRDPVVLYAGRLRPEKGIHTLIEAIPLILDAAPEATLRIVGDGPLESRVRKVASATGGRVRVLGRLSPEALHEEYRRARVAVVPSTWKEYFGLVGPEAMAAGTPVVGSDLGGVREWLHHGRDGLAVPPGDAGALAGAVAELLRDPARARTLGAGALDTAHGLSMAAHAVKLATLYREFVVTPPSLAGEA